MNKGRRLLRNWVDANFERHEDAAKFLGWEPAYLSRLMSENEKVQIGMLGLENALHLQYEAGIAVEAWSNMLDKSNRPLAGAGSKRKVS